MDQLRIDLLALEEITNIYNTIMKEDFPPEERKPLEWIIKLINQGLYQCNGLYFKGELVAYAFVVFNDTKDNILVDYLAVRKDTRGKGYGSIMLTKLKEKYDYCKGIFIESERIDKSIDEKQCNIRTKRIDFYKHNDFVVTGVSTKLYDVYYSILYYSINDELKEFIKEEDKYIKENLDNIYHVLFSDKVYEEKVDFVNQKIMLAAINAKYIHSNLAVYCLKEYADSKNLDTKLCNPKNSNILIGEYTINQYVDYIVSDIYKKKPNVLAFSCYIWNIEYVCQVIEDIKKVLKNVRIWVGGPEVSYRAEEFLKRNPQVEGVMCGEGEKIFSNMVSYFTVGDRKLQEIKGIVYRNNGIIARNDPEEIIDLSEVPFPYSDLTKFENKIIYYESSRGCPFSCSYCLSSIDKKLRFRNIEMVKKELRYFLDNKVSQVKFVDRTFNCNKTHSIEIWKYILENDNGTTNFHFEVSADLLGEIELELFRNMRPGLIQLEIGVQSTNSDTIRAINRNMDLEKLEYVVQEINKMENIHQHLDLIAGLPMEDYNTFSKSFNEIYRLNPKQLQLGFLKILSGANMEKYSKSYGMEYTSRPPYEILSTNWLTYHEVLKLKSVENVVEIYYNSGQFSHTMNYLVNKFESPFSMYERLGEYYEKNGLNEMKHSRISRYKILLDFIKKYSDEINIFSQLLTYDIYLRENIKSRPEFSKEYSEYKDKYKEIYNNYKDKGKNIHIEPFDFDVNKLYEFGILEYTETHIMFDYLNRNPITYEAGATVINGSYHPTSL